jgi:hypothetical protein
MSNKNIQDEILNNSKFAKFFVNQDELKNASQSTKFENRGNTKILSQQSIEKTNEEKKLNESFIKLRESNPQVLADHEAEAHIQNLRDIGEYNRWSLKLVQKWLTGFYSGKYS